LWLGDGPEVGREGGDDSVWLAKGGCWLVAGGEGVWVGVGRLAVRAGDAGCYGGERWVRGFFFVSIFFFFLGGGPRGSEWALE